MTTKTKPYSFSMDSVLLKYSPQEIFLVANKMQELAEDIQDFGWIQQQKSKKKKYFSADILDASVKGK